MLRLPTHSFPGNSAKPRDYHHIIYHLQYPYGKTTVTRRAPTPGGLELVVNHFNIQMKVEESFDVVPSEL